MNTTIGYVGLGKMGKNMVARLLEKGWSVTVFDQDPSLVQEAQSAGAQGAGTLREIGERLALPRIVWVMVPSGKAVEEVLFGPDGLSSILSPGDIVIDGGNSLHEDSSRRAKELKKSGIIMIDAGVSGGPRGARNGAALMIGGEKQIVEKLAPLWEDLSIPGGWTYMGASGSGHFVKMVHNGIEYGMMQSLAEGFEILKNAPFKLDMLKIAEAYNKGSVIESRLVGWLAEAYGAYGTQLAKISSEVGHTGEGEWTVQTAKKLGVDAKVIADSVKFRMDSGKKPSYAGKVLSALRATFGGHAALVLKKKRKA